METPTKKMLSTAGDSEGRTEKGEQGKENGRNRSQKSISTYLIGVLKKRIQEMELKKM